MNRIGGSEVCPPPIQAARALNSSTKIVIIGYGMPTADERARDLLLGHSNPDADILVFSGSRTGAIREEFRKWGFLGYQIGRELPVRGLSVG